MATECGRRPLPWSLDVEGTLTVVDISGFTSLSERLAASGLEGAERLTEIINRFFGRMLTLATGYGGDTLAFAGDAVFLFFSGEDHPVRAVEASLAMLSAVTHLGSLKVGSEESRLDISIGAHSGSFLPVVAGRTSERLQLFLLGSEAETAVRAQAQATKGELVVSKSTADSLSEGYSLTLVGNYLRVRASTADRPREVRRQASCTCDDTLPILASMVPAISQATAHDEGSAYQATPEHRRVAVVFINLLGTREVFERDSAKTAAWELQAYVDILLSLCSKHHGFLVSSDIATNGLKLIVTFGAPLAHEYAAANAARFVLELDRHVRTSGCRLRHRIGVNGGHVFAGEVGPSFRRQYTVMGDEVNVAARLMAAAEPGQILVSRGLLQLAGATFCSREMDPIRVKGKQHPIAVCVLEEERGPSVAGAVGTAGQSGAMFGRVEELRAISGAWGKARAGKGLTVVIEGDAGVGKTRLVEETLRAILAPGHITRTACYEYLQGVPFAPWVDGLNVLLDIPMGATAEERTAAAERRIRELAPDLIELGPLINMLVGVSLPSTSLVQSLDAGGRRNRLFELLTRLVVAGAERRGHVGHLIVVEDVHWIDESSLALLQHLSQSINSVPILLLLTTRPADGGLEMPGEVARIPLGELTLAEARAMVRLALGLDELPAEVGDAIYAKTRGNPLFLEEVIHALRVPGVLEGILSATSVTRAAQLAALEIPDRVQGLLMSRVDRLPPDTREVLKSASVVGRSFGLELVAGLEDELLRRLPLQSAVEELVSTSLIVPDSDGVEGVRDSFSFRHALVQEVAYDSLPFSRRRVLHDCVARYLETVVSTADHGLLVHHYSHSGNEEKTRYHAVKASDSSVAVYAYNEAVDYVRIALDATRSRAPGGAYLRSRLEERAGDYLETLARHDEALEFYARARDRWKSPLVRAATDEATIGAGLGPIADPDARDGELCWKIAVSAERGRSAYRRALQWLDRAVAVLPADRKGAAARVLITRSVVLARIGRFADSLRAGEDGLILAREDGDAALQAYALTMLTNALFGLGLLDRAISANKEAVILYEQVGDLAGQGSSHGNLASCYQLTGDLRAALRHHELALALHARLSYTTGMAITHNNLGELLLQMGHTTEAVEHLEEAVRHRAEKGVPPSLTGFALVNLSRARLRLGELEAAEQALAEGQALLRSINAKGLLLDAGIQEARLHLSRGDLEEAESACGAVLFGARSMGAHLNEAQGLCLLGRIKLARGDSAEARESLQCSAAVAKESGADYEYAQALLYLAEAQRLETLSAPAAGWTGQEGSWRETLEEAIRLFEKMEAQYDLAKALELRERPESTVC